jgi:hypothetical protein
MHLNATGIAPFLIAALSACAGSGSEGAAASPEPQPAPTPTAASLPGVAPAERDEPGEVVHELSDSLLIVFQDSRNTYWFGSDGQGVYRVDGKHIVRYTTRDGLADDHIRQILEDGSGNLYFTTWGGISRFDGRRFSTLVPIESSTSASEWKSEPGDLWFTGGNGPYRYDGTSLYHLEFPRIALEDVFNALAPGARTAPMPFTPSIETAGALCGSAPPSSASAATTECRSPGSRRTS